MSNPNTINAALLAPFDASLIEDKQGKRYIGHEQIRMRVIEATGNKFDWVVTGREIRDQDGVIRARSKTGTIPPVMIVDGMLTIPGLGARAGTGVQVLEEGAGEDTYKAAESDAFKRAAMAFGVGLSQLYMSATSAPPARATSRPQTRQQSAPTPEPAAQPPTPVGKKPASSMPLDELEKETRAAWITRDSATLAHLCGTCPPDELYWVTLVKASTTAEQVDWTLRQLDKRELRFGESFAQEVNAIRGTLND